MQRALDRLRAILAEVDDLQNAAGVLAWDQQTYMPPGGARARANQIDTLRRLAHERFTAPEVGSLLDGLAGSAAAADYVSMEASLVRVTRREYEKAVRIPPSLVVEISRAANEGYAAWVEARKHKDFALFRAPLERIARLQAAKADSLGYPTCRFDALLELREPGLTTAEINALFAELREALVPLVRKIGEKLDVIDDSVLHQPFDDAKQWDAGMEALKAIGFDLQRGRQDRSVHPFTTSFSPHDVRLTTRVAPDFFSAAFFASLHEGGHGLYEQGIPDELSRTPLGGGASGGVHESQSRLWENVVGRSRNFWEYFLPRLKQYFPAQLAAASVESFYRAVNRSEPSLIRVEADEVTYNLHIMLRCDLEQKMLDGDLQVKDLPGAWHDAMESYLGVRPKDDLEGVLQDIHWTFGGFATFPGYTLGNVISAQLYVAALGEHPDIPQRIREGEFAQLLEWTRRHVHRHGAKFTPRELVVKATGQELSAKPYLGYIQAKFDELYEL